MDRKGCGCGKPKPEQPPKPKKYGNRIRTTS